MNGPETLFLACHLNLFDGKLRGVSIFNVPQAHFDRLPGRKQQAPGKDTCWKTFGKYLTFYLDNSKGTHV